MSSMRPRVPSLVLLFAALAGLAPFASATDSNRELSADDLKSLSWRSVGPSNMDGRVSAIALVPGSRTSFYVGYGTGGVFKTTNLGVTFSPVFDKYPVLSIGAIAVADAPADWAGWAKEKDLDAKADRAACTTALASKSRKASSRRARRHARTSRRGRSGRVRSRKRPAYRVRGSPSRALRS